MTKPGKPHSKRKKKTISISVSQEDYEDIILYRDYQDLNMSGIFNKLWSIKKTSMVEEGAWPPRLLDDGDRAFEEDLGRKSLIRNLD